MKLSDHDGADDINGAAALAILRMLFDTLLQKKILSQDEIEIILNCASVDIDNDNTTDVGDRVARIKLLIRNFLQGESEKTLG